MIIGKTMIDGNIYQLTCTKHYEDRITHRERKAGKFLNIPAQIERRIGYDFQLQYLINFLIKERGINYITLEVNGKAVVVLNISAKNKTINIITVHWIGARDYQFVPKEGQAYIDIHNRYFIRTKNDSFDDIKDGKIYWKH